MTFNLSAEKPLEKYRKTDLSIVLLTFLLWGIGIFTLYLSSDAFGSRTFNDSFHFVKRQLISSAAGIIAFCFFAFISMNTIRKLLPVIVIASVVLCLLVLIPVVGITKNGASRWLDLGFTTFQPSEMIKFSIVLYLANYFEKQDQIEDADRKTVFPAVAVTFVMAVIVAIQPDMSTSGFIFVIAIVLFIVSGAKISWLLPVLGILIPCAFLFIVLSDYRLDRIIGFLNPEEYSQTLSYQMISARRAISAGGFWGQGLGSGLSKINSVPEIQSDYIFAGWAEAMGFCGVLAYFLLLGAFVWRGISCAVRASQKFVSVAAFGFVFSIAMQSLLNIAVVGGAVPTTGVPLPFFSSGGSSILFTFASCGFIVNASRNSDIKGRGFTVNSSDSEKFIGDIVYE